MSYNVLLLNLNQNFVILYPILLRTKRYKTLLKLNSFVKVFFLLTKWCIHKTTKNLFYSDYYFVQKLNLIYMDTFIENYMKNILQRWAGLITNNITKAYFYKIVLTYLEFFRTKRLLNSINDYSTSLNYVKNVRSLSIATNKYTSRKVLLSLLFFLLNTSHTFVNILPLTFNFNFINFNFNFFMFYSNYYFKIHNW